MSDWLNGAVGLLTIGLLGWSGTKLVEVREDVAFIKGEMKAVQHLEEDVDKMEVTLSDHEKRLVILETKASGDIQR